MRTIIIVLLIFAILGMWLYCKGKLSAKRINEKIYYLDFFVRHCEVSKTCKDFIEDELIRLYIDTWNDQRVINISQRFKEKFKVLLN